jgi:hypothetical protein
MTASLKQLCLKKLSICEFDIHSLPNDFGRDISIMYYNRCLNQIRERVQKFEGAWNNFTDFERHEDYPHFYRIYHHGSESPKWYWVQYWSLSDIAEHDPSYFIRSSTPALQYHLARRLVTYFNRTNEFVGKRYTSFRSIRDELLDKRPEKKRRMC